MLDWRPKQLQGHISHVLCMMSVFYWYVNALVVQTTKSHPRLIVGYGNVKHQYRSFEFTIILAFRQVYSHFTYIFFVYFIVHIRLSGTQLANLLFCHRFDIHIYLVTQNHVYVVIVRSDVSKQTKKVPIYEFGVS